MPKGQENEVAFSWIRYSSSPQEDGDSVRRQVSLRDAWLARHPEVFLDNSMRAPKKAQSAFGHEHRTDPGSPLAHFITEVEKNRVRPGAYLLAENLDRLTREHPIEALQFILPLISHGIRVVQLAPYEVVYDSEMDTGKLMMMVSDLSRGHGESERKSAMLTEVWAEKKRKAREGVPRGRTAPAWIELRDGKYRLIPERAKAVRLIYKWSAAGLGVRQILQRLIAEGIKPFGRKPKWCRGYLVRILCSRAPLGEYQPGKGRGGAEKDGDPIPGYYPAAVSEAEWHAAQQSKKSRKHHSGRPSLKGGPTSPFSGLLFSAVDGEKLRTKLSHSLHFLVSSGRVDGHPNTDGSQFPLGHLVDGLLSQLQEVAAADLFNDPGAAQVQEIEGKLGEVERRLEVARQHFRSERDSAVWAEEVTMVDRERRALLEARDEARRAAANPVSATWSEAIDLMKRNDPVRLRQCILGCVEEVWCLFVKRAQQDRFAAVQVWFVGGGKRDYFIHSHIPCGHNASKRTASGSARSLADVVASDFDLREREQAAKLSELIRSLSLEAFQAPRRGGSSRK